MIKLYIGSLELLFPNLQNTLNANDTKFTSPVLPSEKSITINIAKVQTLDISMSKSNTLTSQTVWFDGDRETRLYKAYHKNPYIMSTLENDTVEIMIVEKEWTSALKTFRPWYNIHLEQLLLRNNALILHSSSIIVNGSAIIFTAPSGTGKTTQSNLWHKYVPKTQGLNGDRTLLQKTNHGWLACGFPISGSSLVCEQCAVPIKTIAVIRQSKTDCIKELTVYEKFSLLYSELTVFSPDTSSVVKTIDLLNDFISTQKVIMLECTMEKSAVDVLKKYIEYEG